jgi:phage protein D
MAKVIQTEGMHDTAIITLRDEATEAPELQPGTPMMMPYGYSPIDMGTFYGYVDHLQSHYERLIPDGSTYEDVVCMGVSYALKDPFVGSWTNVPASAVVQRIAQRYMLSLLVDTGDYAWPQLSSPGSSAWSYIGQLAQKIGYTFSCNKSLLRFVSIETSMRQHWVNMPVFKSRNAAPDPSQQSIIRFNSMQAETLPINGSNKAVRQVSGMDLRTGKIIGASDDGRGITTKLGATAVYPFFTKQISDTVVSSQGSAQATLAGMTEANRWSYRASATLNGLTTVVQGMPIVIMGIDSNNDGVWWCQEVCHKIESQGYSMDVVLGRDSIGDNGVRPIQATGVAYAKGNPFPYSSTNAPKTILVKNRWRAATSFQVNVS